MDSQNKNIMDVYRMYTTRTHTHIMSNTGQFLCFLCTTFLNNMEHHAVSQLSFLSGIQSTTSKHANKDDTEYNTDEK